MKNKLVLGVYVLFLSGNVLAGKKIEGAFGVKLGQKFDISSAIGQIESSYKETAYEFNSSNKFKSFNRYYVYVTPLSHRVFRIYATGDGYTHDECDEEASVVHSLLKDKYKFAQSENFSVSSGGTLKAGNVDVGVSCLMENLYERGVNLNIRYTDNHVMKMVNKEYKDIRIKEERTQKYIIKEKGKKYDAKGL